MYFVVVKNYEEIREVRYKNIKLVNIPLYDIDHHHPFHPLRRSHLQREQNLAFTNLLQLKQRGTEFESSNPDQTIPMSRIPQNPSTGTP